MIVVGYHKVIALLLRGLHHIVMAAKLLTEKLKLILNSTPLKTNMSPENQWLEDVFPTEIGLFLGDMLDYPECKFPGNFSPP